MTWRWRTIDACSLDELLDDLNRQMKELEHYTGISCGDAVGGGGAFYAYRLFAALAGSVYSDYDGAGDGETWANVRASSGADMTTGSFGMSSLPLQVNITEGASGVLWGYLRRPFVTFDTSVVNGTIHSGSVRMKVSTVAAPIGLSFGLYCYTPGVALPTGPVIPNDAFWADILANTSALASDTTYNTGDLSGDDLLAFDLNAAGKAHLDFTGTTVFSMFWTKDFLNTDPGSTGAGLSDFFYSYAINASEGDKPELDILVT